MASHRLTVDTYAAQHPGTPSAQSIRSVAVHLISLHAVLECSMNHRAAAALIKACVDKGRFEWLAPPQAPFLLTILHPLADHTPRAHAVAVAEWARATWEAWADHHEQVRHWARQYRA